ncbi:MAG: hypothetical protein KGZ87_09080 [Bacteroidetes bacterium]|nr:hypothetical protein [Bacteroidota bacterium]
MKSIKTYIILSTRLLAVLILLPSFIQLNHSIENHSFHLTAHKGINIDNSNPTCQLLHDLFLLKSSLPTYENELNAPQIWDTETFNLESLIAIEQLFAKKYRGPPTIIV